MGAGWEVTLSRVLRSRLRVQHLQMIVALSETGSVCGAARVLGLTQPAITKSLHELERLLDCKLFVRSTHGVTPTEPCKELLRLARRFTGDLEVLMKRLESLRTGEQGSLRLGAQRGTPLSFATQLLARLREESPQLQIRLLVGEHAQLGAELLQGGIDMALLCKHEEDIDDDLSFARVASLHPTIVARSGHPLADMDTVDSASLQRQGWLLHSSHDPMMDLLISAFRRAGLPPPCVDIEGVGTGSAIELLRNGDQLAFLDRNSVAKALTEGTLVELGHELVLPPLPYGVAWPSNAESNAILDQVRMLVTFEAAHDPIRKRAAEAPHRAYDDAEHVRRR